MPAAAAVGAASIILFVAGVIADQVAQIILNEYFYAATYNSVRDPLWGICTMERYHLIYGFPPVDTWSWANFHVVYYDGGVKQIAPFPYGVYYMTYNNALTIINFFTAVYNYCGFEHWVWLGPYVILE